MVACGIDFQFEDAIHVKFISHFQIGDLKGLFGLLMVNMQMLRDKLKVLDVSYGTGTGRLVVPNLFKMKDILLLTS